MNLLGGYGKGTGRRALASAAIVALTLVLGAGPVVALDTVPPAGATGTAQAVTDPAVTDPAVTDPAVTDPAVTDPAVTEPSTTDPAVTEPPASSPKSTKKLAAADPSAFLVAPGAACPTGAQVAGASSPGGFEIDGNCQSNGALDWESPEVGNQPVTDDMVLDAGDTTEFIANAGKTDIRYVYAYGHGDAAAVWLDFAFARDKATGSVRYELELNQAAANTGPTNSVPARTVGDYKFNITQGGNGAFALNSVQRWTGTTWGAPFGTAGVVGTSSADGFFFELSLNLTTLTGVSTSCPPSALFATVNLRTQTSESDNSAFADYITGLTIPPPSNCPALTLNKNVVGGIAAASAWTLTAQADTTVPATLRTVSGPTGVTGQVVPAKAYALSESGPAAYTGSLWTCPGGTVSGPLGSQTVTVGTADVTCTITNTATSTLTVKKTNPAGDALGGATFVLHSGSAAGTSVGSCTTTMPSGTCSVSGLAIGSYYWVETVAPAGYLLPTGSAAIFGPVVITASNAGQTIATTVVSDVPETHLTLVKAVSNTFGGTAVASAWTLAAAGPTPGVTGATGAAAVTNVLVSPGSYALSESGGPSGYAGTWACSGATLGAGDQVSIGVGQSATCTVTNRDQAAHLTLVKEVTNANGGGAVVADWTLTAAGPTPGVSGLTGAAAVTNAAVSAGTYTLSESGPSGYAASAWSCTAGILEDDQLTLALNQSATCTVINTDQAAHLTLVKAVTNDNGGTELATAWTLSADGPTPMSGQSGTTGAVSAGTYTLSEDGPSGYVGSVWVCTAGSLAGSQLTLSLNQSATCTITNNDQAAHLTLVKAVTNANGGGAVVSDWTLTAAGPTTGVTGITGSAAVTGAVVNAGTYTLSESGPSGYAASAWVCTAGILDGAQLTLALDQTATCTVTNTDQPAHLTLVKQVVNASGGTQEATAWTLSASGPTPMSGQSGTTGAVSAGTYTLSEDGPSGYLGSAWVCTAGSLNGAQLTLSLNQSATCTITNTDMAAHLTLVKEVVNANGGDAPVSAWTLTATGPTTGVTGITGAAAVTDAAVNAGTYSLSESGPSGYAASAWSCTAGILDGAQLTLALDQDATCTVINTDQPAHLTLLKSVVNANGGTEQASAWTLSADGPTPMSGQSGTTGAVSAGTYTLSEDGPAGYVGSAWECTAGILNGAQLTLSLNQSATCTITNTDLPAHLTLVKTVTNDDGGQVVPTAWTLTATGPTSGVTGASGASAVTDAAVDAGTYILSESGGPAGYTASGWSCTAGSLNGAALTLALNQSATCTINNNDQPAHLTLVKEVANNSGGNASPQAWTLTATGPTDGVSGKTGSAAVTNAAVSAGVYTLSEAGGPPGYAASAWTCTGGSLSGDQLTLTVNQSATCTVINTDQAAQLTLLKSVVNTSGGTAQATAWTLHADGPSTMSGTTGTSGAVMAGTYTLSESDGPSGYAGSAWACSGGSLVGAQLTLSLNESATCTITNTDQPAHLTLVKSVENENGGTAEVSAWTLTATGPTAGVSGITGSDAVTAATVNAGTYTLSESGGPLGYAPSAWSCDADAALRGSELTLALGQSVTCTITNTDLPGHLTLVKEVVNANGGTEHATAWTLSAAGPTPLSGITGTDAVSDVPVDAGIYTLSESIGPDGYAPSAWVCNGVAVSARNEVTVALDESVTCVITNSDQPLNITLAAQVVNTFGGGAAVPDFTLTAFNGVDDDPAISGITGNEGITGATLTPGTYSLGQTPPPTGYTTSAWACEGGELNGSDITVALGDSVVCTIVYTDSPAHLTLVKKVVNGHGGTAVATDWLLSGVGPVTFSGTSGSAAVTSVSTAAGDFELAEGAGPAGYTASGWVCVNGALDGATVTVSFIQNVTCTITNTQNDPASPIPPVVPPVVPADPAAPIGPILALTGAGIVPLGLSGLIVLVLGGILTVAGRGRGRGRARRRASS